MASAARARDAPSTGDGRKGRLLDLAPDLGSGLSRVREAEARTQLAARELRLPPGAWARAGLADDPAWAAVVVEGLLLRDIALTGARCSELLGKGDAFDPHESGEDELLLPLDLEWTVLEPTRLVLLDPSFAAAAVRWPELAAEVQARAAARTFRLSVQMAICQLPRVELRLLLILWHLAERWGRVGPDGVVLPLRLSHRVLGQLVGARRPTVSLALSRLHEGGLVERHEAGWQLHGQQPMEMRDLGDVGRATRSHRPTVTPAPGAPLATVRERMREQVRERIDDLAAEFEARAVEIDALRGRAQELQQHAAKLRAAASATRKSVPG